MLEFQRHQKMFIDHIRDPSGKPLPTDIEDRRMNIYRELFFNNILGFISNGFPVLKSLYTEKSWQALVRRFFKEHQCESPHFVDISQEFVGYLQHEYSLTADDPAFMLELAHYEWLELDISVRRIPNHLTVWDGESPIRQLAFSPLATLVSYQFPVHQISVDFQPQAPQEQTYLVVYRARNNEVNFTQVNAITAKLLLVVQQQSEIEINQLCQSLSEAIPEIPFEQLASGAQEIIQRLLKQQILLPA